MGKSIDRVSVREGLKVRREPYWLRLERGRSIGFRRQSTATAGTWIARYYDSETDQYPQMALGDLAALAEKDRFDEAKRLAEEWFRHLDLGVTTKAETIKEACRAYADKLRREKSEESAKYAEANFRRLVNDDAIGKIELTKAKPAHFQKWRERILERGSKSDFNRNLTPLRAAMYQAYDERKVSSDFAWQKALRPLRLDPTEGRRVGYLDTKQRHALFEKASDDLKPLLKAWALLPLRPGDAAKLKVVDLDVKQRTLTIPTGKTGSRVIPLTNAALAHFRQCAKDKLPGAWLVSRADGSQWDRFAWRDEMQEAVKASKLPKTTVAYTIRHSVITDLIVIAGLDLLSVAKLSGSSIDMIDRHYGKLKHEHAREALKALTI